MRNDDRRKNVQATSGDKEKGLDRPAVRLRFRGISLPERYRRDWGEAPKHGG